MISCVAVDIRASPANRARQGKGIGPSVHGKAAIRWNARENPMKVSRASFYTDVIVPRGKAKAEANAAIPAGKKTALVRAAKALIASREGKGKTCAKLQRAIDHKDYARIEKTLNNVLAHA